MVRDPRFHNEDGELVRMAISPRPYQNPIPMYQMAESPASIERAARRGIGTMSQSLSAGRLRDNWELYRDTAREAHGRPYALGEGLAVMRPTYIAETREEAERDARHGFNLLGQWGSTASTGLGRAWSRKTKWRRAISISISSSSRSSTALLLIGTPESVAEQIDRLQSELHCEHLALFLNIPLLSYEQVTRSLRLFGRGDHAEVCRHARRMPGRSA